MNRGDCNEWVALRVIGLMPVLFLSSDEVHGLTPMDLSMLQGDLGASDGMLDHLRELARTPGLCLRCDFDRQAVRIVDPETGE
jgi:hypothetical protein